MKPKFNDPKHAKKREYVKAYRKANPDYVKRQNKSALERTHAKKLEQHGLTEESFQSLLINQGNRCPICGSPFTAHPAEANGPSRAGKPHVDHDHITNEVRGLLCMQCNSMLGFARDNLLVLRKAFDYLYKRGVNAPRRGWSGSVVGKVWGETVSYVSSPFMELHRINVLPHSQCSLHKHDMKYNAFVVLAGVLFVDVHNSGYELVDVTELHQFDVMTIKPGEYHRFRTGEIGAEALEIYYPDGCLADDIVRKDVGSRDEMIPSKIKGARNDLAGTG